MRREITHHEAAKVLTYGGGIVYTQNGVAFKVDPCDPGNNLQTPNVNGVWGAAPLNILDLFAKNDRFYVSAWPLPPLPRGYRWGGNNPLAPDRVEEVLPCDIDPKNDSRSSFVTSRYCSVAANQNQRDICAAVVALYDQQHLKP